MKTIAFMNQKGGVGKTTTAFHFAAYLSRLGKKVLCIDLDSQGSLSFCMNAKTQNENTLLEFITGQATFSETVQQSRYGDILPSDNALGIYSERVENLSNRYTALFDRLVSVKDNYDFVLLDCPPNINIYNYNALYFADAVVIVVQAEALSLLGLPQVFNLIHNCETVFGKKIAIAGILISMYNGALKISRELLAQLKEIVEKYDIFSYNTLLKKLTAISEATLNQLAVFDYKPNSQASDLYLSACEEIYQSIK